MGKSNFNATTISGQKIIVSSSIEGFTLFQRGDCVLIDVLDERWNKTGNKKLVFIAGFTHCSRCYPPHTIWFGDIEKIIKEEKVLVFGCQWTESTLDQMIKIEIPNKQLRDLVKRFCK